MSQTIYFPQGPIVDPDTGRLSLEWFEWLQNPQTLTLTLGSALDVTSGGTGLSSYTIGDIIYASAATTLAALHDVATGNALLSGGVGAAPSWGKVGLTTHISGILPIANGGTNSAVALSGNSIMVSDGSSIAQGQKGTATTLLHGNAAGAPTYSSVNLAADVTGILPVTNGGTAADLSATGGTHQFLKQSTLGGAVSVGTIASADLPAGTGTVTSVALTVPSEFSVAGSPVTTSGTLAVTSANQNARAVWAGPLTGAAATPSFKIMSYIKHKDSDQSLTTTTTLTNDNDLFFPISANEDWVCRAYIDCGAALQTTGLKITVTAPTGATGGIVAGLILDSVNAGDTAMQRTSTLGTALDFTTTNLNTSNNALLELAFHVLNGANAGNVQIQFAQSTSSATALTFRSGSQLKADRAA